MGEDSPPKRKLMSFHLTLGGGKIYDAYRETYVQLLKQERGSHEKQIEMAFNSTHRLGYFVS